MIDAGTISARMTLDVNPFEEGIQLAMRTIGQLDIFSGESGGRIGLLGDVLRGVGSSALSFFAQPIDSARASVSTSLGLINSAFSLLTAGSLAAGGIFAGNCSLMGQAMNDAKSSISANAQSAANGMISPFVGARTGAISAGANICAGLMSGLASRQASLFAKAAQIANGITARIRSALKIASPSRVMMQLGRYTGEGMALGLSESERQVRQNAASLATAATEAVQGVDIAAQPTLSRSMGAFSQGYAGEYDLTAVSANAGQTALLERKMDTIISLLEQKQSIDLDGRTFGQIVRKVTQGGM